MECPICIEPADNQSVLECGHFVHTKCLKEATDAMQDQLVEDGYPPLMYAKCPLCRAVQKNIIAKAPLWLGSIELDLAQINELMALFTMERHWIAPTVIPNSISDQMPDAHQHEQCRLANTVASMIYLMEEIPQTVILKQLSGGRLRYKYNLNLPVNDL